jgi:lysophospholipase L1-like esterase
VVLGGCGSSSPYTPPRPERPFVAALGDSITAGSPAWDPNPEAREKIGTGADPRSQYEYWAQLKRPEWSFRNCGVPGERTDQIARRLSACIRGGASVLIVQGGVNDIAQGESVDDAASNLESMVRRGKQRGLRVLLAEVLPWTHGHPGADEPIRQLNARIRAIAAREGVTVLPWFDALENPRRPGQMRPELDAEGDHPNAAGYRVMGRIAGERLPARTPAP